MSRSKVLQIDRRLLTPFLCVKEGEAGSGAHGGAPGGAGTPPGAGGGLSETLLDGFVDVQTGSPEGGLGLASRQHVDAHEEESEGIVVGSALDPSAFALGIVGGVDASGAADEEDYADVL